MLRWIWVWLGLACANVALAESEDRALTSGLALGAGYGYENGGLGGHVGYHVQLSERWRLVPHVGLGWLQDVAYGAGLATSFGRSHRFVIDLLWGPYGQFHGQELGRNGLRYGGGLMLGWEYVARFGLLLRATVGAGVSDAIRHDPREMLSGNVSVGYKLW